MLRTKHLVAGALLGISLTAAPLQAFVSPSYEAQPAVSYSASSLTPMNLSLPMKVFSMDNHSRSDVAADALKSKVAASLANEKFALEGGGFIEGSAIINEKGEINDAIYSQLSKEGQKDFVSKLASETDRLTNPENPNYDMTLARDKGVDRSTASDWFKDLRNHSGIGSQMLTEILRNGVYADLNTGAEWFRPFNGPLSSFLGFMCILVISLLGIRAIMDLSYLTIPAFQAAMNGIGSKGGKGEGGVMQGRGGVGGGASSGSNSIFISKTAVDISQKETGNPVWAYLKKAAFEYLVLGVAILFLCFNVMWDIVGLAMDMGTGLI